MQEYAIEMLTTLGEAGGVAGIVGAVLFMLIKTIKKNGCTFRCHSCAGKPVMEVDCEEGAPTARHFPRPWRKKSPQRTETTPEPEV